MNHHQHHHHHHNVNQIRTIGMKIDSVIAKIDSIPHTYQAFVVVCCLFAFLVLNSNPNPSSSTSKFNDNSVVKKTTSKATTTTSTATCNSNSNSNSEPQPKWHILKLLNYLSIITLISSFLYFCTNPIVYLNDSNAMVKFTAIWTALLCYFFGFFGISFIDEDELERGANATNANANAEGKNVNVNVTVNSNQHEQNSLIAPRLPLPLHPPAACTPVCSDPPASVQLQAHKSSSSNSSEIKDVQSLSNEEIASLVLSNKIKDHRLEKLTDPDRAVVIRRAVYSHKIASLSPSNDPSNDPSNNPMDDLPHLHSLNYSKVHGANCETVIGYIPLPVGIVGPITLNNQSTYFPMATTEGCLVASTNRGCKAITGGGGARSVITRDGITRAPCLQFPSATLAAQFKLWCEIPDNFRKLKAAFESTTSFGKLEHVSVSVGGRNAYLRLRCFAGDAMGMNMVSKGSLAVIDYLKSVPQFSTMKLIALSGNVCTDKKAAAMNWIEGRGKSVVVEAIIPKDVVRDTLKTTVRAMVDVNINKNLIGSALAGVVGGYNAHASNIVSAVFLATGQDPAQNVESSNCMTLMEENERGDLWISCTMPSIEVGTVGGGTGLAAQAACLEMIGCRGGGERAGDNAKKLAHVVAAAVMAGELSLLAALAANTLVQAHMTHNRKAPSVSK